MRRRESLGAARKVGRPAVAAGVFLVPVLAAISGLSAAEISAGSKLRGDKMAFVEDKAKGQLTIMDGGAPVLTYCYGDQLKPGADPALTRSCYIHPLYALDGRVLTDDFPADHVHHHGLFWGWPLVKTRGVTTSNWEHLTPSLRQVFTGWLKKGQEGGAAVLGVENAWTIEGRGVVAKEIVTIRVPPADEEGRAIDLELLIVAVGAPLELQGRPDERKGYGGLCFRSSPLLKSAAMTTDRGRLAADAVNEEFRWADLSTGELGIALFAAPDHPGAPVHWMVRNSYGGIINPSWPGLQPVTLVPSQPVELRYRIYVHRGDAAAGQVREAYERYVAAEPPRAGS